MACPTTEQVHCICNGSALLAACPAVRHSLDCWEDPCSSDDENNFLGFFQTAGHDMDHCTSESLASQSSNCSNNISILPKMTCPTSKHVYCICNGLAVLPACPAIRHSLDCWEDCSSSEDENNFLGFFQTSVHYTEHCKSESPAPQSNNCPTTVLNFKRGELVWGKFPLCPWWPAVVITSTDCGIPIKEANKTWVFWFGDKTITKVSQTELMDFKSKFCHCYVLKPKKKTMMYFKAVHEALVVIADRLQANFLNTKNVDALIEWAKCGFCCIKRGRKRIYEEQEQDSTLPDFVCERLEVIRKQNEKAFALSSRALATDGKLLCEVREGRLKITDICISCLQTTDIVEAHPLFCGGICIACKENLCERIWACGEDGVYMFCTICCNAGNLVICDGAACNRSFCEECIEALIGPGTFAKVAETEQWSCYLCSPEKHGLIKRQEMFQQNILNFFSSPRANEEPTPPPVLYKREEGIRVLSLYDGIGTGKFVLEKLKIPVDTYFACEIDRDSIHLTSAKLSEKLVHLGDIRNITPRMIEDMSPIDLVLGGSPCNDLSLVNPARKGLFDHSGTGVLFFEFTRILTKVQEVNKGRHVFWLFENVAAMPRDFRDKISHYLKCEPVLLDSKHFSPQHRPRYFWGNIPGMFRPLQSECLWDSPNLQSALIPGLGREAVVDKIRTVTTRANSLKQGKNAVLPVKMNGIADSLWITELETIFGFPHHFTDIGNMLPSRRQQLLGKAWSAQVIEYLLAPLQTFFA